MSDTNRLKELLHFYEDHLRREVMPFWLENCIDREFGGINNMVSDDGRVLSTDKIMWSQGRALWTFSALYNQFDQDRRWLEIADSIADFIWKYGQDPDGAWVFRLRKDGTVVEPAKSIYVDAFIACGMTEYARATGSKRALQTAVQIYERTSPLLDDHSNLPTAPYSIPPGLQSHGPLMIFANMYHELGVYANQPAMVGRALELAERIMTEHVKPEHRILFELVKKGGEPDPSDLGKTFVPGHIVESMWFLERIYAYHRRQDRVELALEVMNWALEKGWDKEYGGLYLARHAEGGTPVWNKPDVKAWWCAVEAIYALIRAYEISGNPHYLQWHEKVHDYAFRHYHNKLDGEWFQYVDREGNKIGTFIPDLPVKDPFHLPRALIYSIQALRRMTEAKRRGTKS